MFLQRLRIITQIVGSITIIFLSICGMIFVFQRADDLIAATGLVTPATAAPISVETTSLSLQANTASTTVPPYLNYQGILRNAEGQFLNGEYDMTFRIYHSPADNDVKWNEAIQAVTVRDGRFSVLLGNTTPLTDTTLFATPDTYLGVTVDGLDEMVPRQRFASVPYAMVAADAMVAAELNGQDVTTRDTESQLVIRNPTIAPDDFVAHGANMRIDGNNGEYSLWMGADENAPWIGSRSNHDLRIITNNLEKMRVTENGNVGIGTIDPEAALHIIQGSGYGIRYENSDRSKNVMLQTGGEAELRSTTSDIWIEPAPGRAVRLNTENNGEVSVGGILKVDENVDVGGEIHGRLRLTSEYHWKKGDAPKRMIEVSQGFCFLTLLTGEFDGGGEVVEIVEEDGYWWLKGNSGAGNTLQGKARCAG